MYSPPRPSLHTSAPPSVFGPLCSPEIVFYSAARCQQWCRHPRMLCHSMEHQNQDCTWQRRHPWECTCNPPPVRMA